VLILEDVHWIDKASEEVLTTVVEAMGGVPLLLALVYRPEYLHAWANEAYHAQIALTRLPGASIAVLRAIKAENELALAYAGYGRLHRQQGHIAPARDYLTRALAIFERLGTLGEPDRVRQVLAELPEG
jgi:tetratricopeptide (TPR) repeat protein